MKHPRLATELVPVKEFRASLASWVERVQETGRPVVLTQRGKAAAVLVRPETLDEIEEEREVVRMVLQGLREAEADELVENDQVWARVEEIVRRAEQSDADPMDPER